MPNIEITRHKSSKKRCCNSVHTEYLKIKKTNYVAACYITVKFNDQHKLMLICTSTHTRAV